MALFMTVAAVWGAVQVAGLAWFAGRSIGLGTTLLGVVLGAYGCGVAAVVLQFTYTRTAAAVTGDDLFEVVRFASYTVDPFIEEVVKILPLLVLGLVLRQRRQWGLTDFVVLGAAIGSGFGLLEAVLRFGHRPDQVVGTDGGWYVASSLSPPFVPDLAGVLGAWLPAPVSSGFLGADGPQTAMHLAWSAVAGLGVGLLLRGHLARRVLGVLPLLWVAAEHAAYNYDAGLGDRTELADLLSSVFLVTNGALWLYPIVALGVAAWFDRRDLRTAFTALPDVRLAGAPAPAGAVTGPASGGAAETTALLRFALLRPPWTLLIAARFVRARRALGYALARGGGPDADAWHDVVRRVRDQIARTAVPQAWANTPIITEVLRPPALTRSWRLLVWLALLAPAFVFFVLGGFRRTAFIQDALTTSAGTIVLTGFLLAGLVWLVWQLVELLRRVPAAAVLPGAEPVARAYLRLAAGSGALFMGAFSLVSVAGGGDLDRAAIRNYHVLDAVAGAIGAVLLLLALAALLSFFPPGGFALATGGVAGGAIALTPEVVATTAAIGALSGVLLAEAAEGSPGSSPDSSRPQERGGPARQDNTRRFDADDFEGTEYSADELAHMIHRHTGSGDMHIGGSAPRPSEAEVLDTLRFGRSAGLEGQNAVQYVKDGIRVIVNRDMPWQSTSYYIGG